METKTTTSFTLSVVAIALAASIGARGASITFNQLDWVSDTGGYTAFNSEWGYARLNFSDADAALFQHGINGYTGFLNVYTEVPGGGDNWAIRNVPIGFQTPQQLAAREGDGFHFNLGIARGSMSLTSLNYRISVDPAPVTTLRGAGSYPQTAPVTKQEMLLGGVGSDDPLDPFDAGGTGQGIPNDAWNYDAFGSADFFNPPPSQRAITGWGTIQPVLIPDRDVPSVDERRNHCSPGSVTRGIHALGRLNPTMNLTDDVGTTQSELSREMGTTEANGTPSIRRMVEGKNRYQQDRGLHIRTRTTRNPVDVANTLGDRGVAEMIVSWGRDRNGQSLGAHAMFVAEVEQTYDANNNLTGYRVRCIDDPRQGDNTAGNRSTWYTFRPDGTMVGGPGTGARLMGFMTETFLPTPGAAVLMSLAGFTAFRRRRSA